MSDELNVETIKKEAETTKKYLEIRRDRKPPMCQRKTISVSALLNYCNRTLFLCNEIEKLENEIKETKRLLEQ